MAEFLIMKDNHTHADPVKDERGCYKRGDIVEVYPDGRCTEPPAPGSPFVIVKIPGLSVELANKYIEAWEDTDPEGKPITRRRRLWRVRVDDLPKSILNKLERERVYEIPWDQVRTFVRNKLTNLDEG